MCTVYYIISTAGLANANRVSLNQQRETQTNVKFITECSRGNIRQQKEVFYSNLICKASLKRHGAISRSVSSTDKNVRNVTAYPTLLPGQWKLSLARYPWQDFVDDFLWVTISRMTSSSVFISEQYQVKCLLSKGNSSLKCFVWTLPVRNREIHVGLKRRYGCLRWTNVIRYETAR